jgi:hypothetical protein
MSRRDVFDLSKAIDLYKENKDLENKLKKSNTEAGNVIKSYFLEKGITSASSEKYTATVITTTKSTLNEELAIEIIKENLGGALLRSVIKKREYIDDDALEKLVYNGNFDITKLEKAKIDTTTQTLRIAKKKEDKLMRVCKYAGDPEDEYCKNCNGCTMEVEGKSISCAECAGYEEGDTDVDTETGVVTDEEPMNPPVEKAVEEKPVAKPVQKANTAAKKTKATNTTSKKEKAEESKNTQPDKGGKVTIETPIKVSEEKHKEEESECTPAGIQVTSLRYTSSATVKKGDNYFKFTAEEEWSTALYYGNIQDVREQLWAKLNAEVDAQIEELNSMN